MAKSPKKPKRNQPDIDLVDDAWHRFERFIKTVTKAGAQHRPASSKGAGRTRRSSK